MIKKVGPIPKRYIKKPYVDTSYFDPYNKIGKSDIIMYQEESQYYKDNLVYLSKDFIISGLDYKQEYSYNNMNHTVIYRDNHGLSWTKLYNKNGFMIYIKSKKKNLNCKFVLDNCMLVVDDEYGEPKYYTYDSRDYQVIQSIDIQDPFLYKNSNLIQFLIEDLDEEKAIRLMDSGYGTEMRDIITQYYDEIKW